MQVDLVAEHQHYYDHLLQIWEALPPNIKGINHGVTGNRTVNIVGDTRVLVAGYSDVIRYPTRPVIYVEHGAGQSYLGLPTSVAPHYSPLTRTKQHRNVVAFICPNDEVANRWTGNYDRPAFAVGCPKLDPWHAKLRGEPEPRTVAITFHWNPPASVWTVVPELQSGFAFYWPALRDATARWRADGWTVLGHAHPRAPEVTDFWRSEGVEFINESAQLLDRATVLIADNTSVQAECMSLGRGVVWLNHPAYRREVEHCGRFWNWPKNSGLEINSTQDLVALDLDSVPASTWHPYAYADGHAAERAAAAILSLEP